MTTTPGKLFLLIGGVALVFGLGALVGGWIIAHWTGSPTPPTIAFVTPTPGAAVLIPPITSPLAATPLPGNCPPPPGHWGSYTVQPGDTLSELAARTGVDMSTVRQVNCLPSAEIMAGQTLYLPALPTPTRCAISPPASWGPTPIQEGDTLTGLAGARGISIDEIRRVNCLPSAEIITGQTLYLPALPTPTRCAISPPASWGPTPIEEGDTLTGLAGARGISIDEIRRVNCLPSEEITAGQTLYLPLLPTATPTPTQPPPTEAPPPTPVPPSPPTETPPPFSIAQLPSSSPASGQQPAELQTSPPMEGGTGEIQGEGIEMNPDLEPVEFVSGYQAQKSPCNNNELIPIYNKKHLYPTPVPIPSIPTPTPDIAMLDLNEIPLNPLNDNTFINNSTLVNTNLNDFMNKNFEDGSLKTPKDPLIVYPGGRMTIFACNFPNPETITASITYPNGLQQHLLSEGFYLPLDNTVPLTPTINGAAIWNISCDLPQGIYTLTVGYNVEVPSDPQKFMQTHIPIQLKGYESKEERLSHPSILVLPQASRSGSSFEVNYCNYNPDTYSVELYHKERFDEDNHRQSKECLQNQYSQKCLQENQLIWQTVATWTVTTNGEGWAKQNLQLKITAPLGKYKVEIKVPEDKGGREARGYFYLIP